MRGWMEIGVFLGLATAVHAAVIAGTLGPRVGPDGAGAGGEAPVILAAVPPGLAQMVQDWTLAPDAAPALATPAPPPPEPAPPMVRAAPDTDAGAPAPAALQAAIADALPMARPAALPAPPASAPDVTAALALPPDAEPTGAVPVIDSGRDAAPHRPAQPPGAAQPASDESPHSAQPPLPARAMSAPPPRPAQTARGQGGTRTAGQAPAPAETPIPATARAPAAQASAVAAWGAGIRARIDARKTPPAGRWTPGQTILRITVARDGRVAGASILRSSGDARLDKAALGAVRRAGRMPRAPQGFDRASMNFDLPVAFAR